MMAPTGDGGSVPAEFELTAEEEAFISEHIGFLDADESAETEEDVRNQRV